MVGKVYRFLVSKSQGKSHGRDFSSKACSLTSSSALWAVCLAKQVSPSSLPPWGQPPETCPVEQSHKHPNKLALGILFALGSFDHLIPVCISMPYVHTYIRICICINTYCMHLFSFLGKPLKHQIIPSPCPHVCTWSAIGKAFVASRFEYDRNPQTDQWVRHPRKVTETVVPKLQIFPTPRLHTLRISKGDLIIRIHKVPRYQVAWSISNNSQ